MWTPTDWKPRWTKCLMLLIQRWASSWTFNHFLKRNFFQPHIKNHTHKLNSYKINWCSSKTRELRGNEAVFFKGILTTPSRVLTWLVLREAKGSFAQGESSVRKEEKHEYFPITSCLSFEIKLNWFVSELWFFSFIKFKGLQIQTHWKTRMGWGWGLQ